MPFNSCIKYFGGKYHGIDKLLHFFPTNFSHTTYVEPFCGSLSVFFNVKPKSAVLNDLDDELTNFWVVVSNIHGLYEEFVELLQRSVYSWEYINELDRAISLSILRKDKPQQCVMRAVKYYLVNRMSFSGFDTKGDIVPNRNILHENLDEWHKCFENADVRIWNKDFREVITRINSTSDKWNDKFIYLDPPYVKAGEAYKHPFTVNDHRDLANLLYKTKYWWVLSYDDHPLIRELYKDYSINEVQWFYSCAGAKTEQKHELIITNQRDDVLDI